jgi:hypothetical protein
MCSGNGNGCDRKYQCHAMRRAAAAIVADDVETLEADNRAAAGAADLCPPSRN